MLAAGGAVVLEALGAVLAAKGAGLLDGFGEQGQGRWLLAAGSDGARVRRGVEHPLEHGRVLGAVGAEAELTGDVHGADRGDCLDSVVTSGCREDVAAGRADAKDADEVRVGLGPGGEVGTGGLEVLDPVRGVFEPAGLAAALPLVSGVESEGNETLLGQPARVEAGGLLLDAAAGMPDDDAGARAGLPETGSRRKVAGLRREEVAQLAAISVDYYTRLEQGRVQASASALATLARALRLDDDQQTYLYELGGKTDARPRRRRAIQRVRPAVRRLLGQLTETPAIVLGRRMDILAWNPIAAALYTDFAQIPAARRNYVRLLFTDPVVRGMHQQWEHDARDAVAALRMEAAKDPDDPELAQLVGELSVQDPDFRTWWAEHHVNSVSYGTKHYQHKAVGDLTLDCDTWASPDGSGQRLMVLTAEPGTPSHDALRILTSWTAGDAGPADTAHQGDRNP
jgi:transcriptional regulator with XRE-family HTH domain